MNSIFADFREAQTIGSGPLLSSTLTPIPNVAHPDRLRAFYDSTNHFNVQPDVRAQIISHHFSGFKLSKTEGNAWVDVYVSYWRFLGPFLAADEAKLRGLETDADWSQIYDAWKDLTNVLVRGYTSAGFQAWTLPCLYGAGKHLRAFAIKADEQGRAGRGNITFSAGFQEDLVETFGKHEKLEDAARVINRIFTLCHSDRAPIEESRKWGLYYTMNLLFKTYFKLNSISLSKNILRALEASRGDMPPLESFPKSHVVTFKYYVGVILFLEEDYVKAEENLTDAWTMCHRDAQRNRELILTYLIPCHLLTTHTLPTAKLLSPYPRLQRLFGPLSICIKRGDLAGFDAALAAGEEEFVKRRIYLTLERGRDVALRNLLRKVFLASGYEDAKDGAQIKVRRTRILVEEFAAAIRLGNQTSGERMDNDEVECLLANMIYKNLMKGYIARERGIVVLSKGGTAFPGTGV
ncbi:MAG: COP9 signalosome (CSN) subunit [Piccolia ochrophora]|nr:MAG: COP9 signalosome (CSN) subunit [Piccolia ochrophora]